MTTIRISANAVDAKLLDGDRAVQRLVSEQLSYRVEGAEQMDAFKKGTWSGRSTFFSFRHNTFPAGFVPVVKHALQKAGYKVHVIRKPAPPPAGPVPTPENPLVDDFPADERYDYQFETVRRLERHQQMIAQCATGAGKSRIAKLAHVRIGRMTLFLTTRSVLMHQMKESIEQTMGVEVGVIGDGTWEPKRGFNVAMVQSLSQAIEEKNLTSEIESELKAWVSKCSKELESLQARLTKNKKLTPAQRAQALHKRRAELNAQRPTDAAIAKKCSRRVDKHNRRREKVLKLLRRFDLVISEEAHEASAEGYYQVLRQCRNAHYRLALTGTPFMRPDDEANMRLMAASGPVGIKVSEKLLIDRGILAKPYFKFVTPTAPPKLYRTTPWQRAYKIGIKESEPRNREIVREALKAHRHGLTVMVLVQHQDHGNRLKKLMASTGLNAQFIFGQHNQERRNKALRDLGAGKLDVLIGSSILDVGVDVPSVGMVILAGGGKAEVALRQRIGRGLRAKKSGPNVCLVVDFADSKNTHLHEHAKSRRAIIERTPGFAEGILPADQEFDYSRFDGMGTVA